MMRRAFIVLVVAIVSLAFAFPAFAEKLTVWAIDMPDDQPDHAYAKALVEGFKAKNSDIELDYVPLGVDPLKDRVKIAMAAGSGMPDVFQSWGGSTLASYADAGRLLDLTAELKGLPGSAAAQQAMSAKGKIYGVAPFFAIAGLFINEGIFKDNGLKVPTTVDELNTVAAALKAKGIQPFACGARDKWPLLAMYMYLTNRYGGEDLFTKAAARKARFDSDGFVKAGQAYQDMLKKGYFGDQPLGEAYGDAQQLMASGKAAMQVSGSWLCANYASKDYTDQTFGFYAFPVVKGGKGKVTDLMGMTDIGYAASIAGKAKKALVVRFMKYAMSPDAAQAEPGRICSVPGVKARNPLTGQASVLFGTGKTVQFWWDQNLPAAVTTPLNDTIQSFALPDTNVKAALTKFEALATENMGKVK
jgi:ABC-type glycerol-3-phosphate transport system substrate-binding protein